MSGTPTNRGDKLQREWSIPARQTRYHRKGDFFMPLDRWPGALADQFGFVVFQSETEMLRNSEIHYRGEGTDHVRLGVTGGVHGLPNYTMKRAFPNSAKLTHQLQWREGEARNCTDILPVSWFERVGRFRDRTHDVKMARGRIDTAKCDVTVNETSADLNYRSHADYNKKHDMQLGIMRIHFENSNRRDIAMVDWAENDDGPFEIYDIEVGSAPMILEEDIAAVKNDSSIDKTTREQLIRARIGQGVFRFALIKRWDQKCSVSKISTLQALRASHIKPWRESTNQERLDPENGLLLTANLDALFDKYLISFDRAGKMLVSERISAAERALLGIPRPLRIKPSVRQRAFLRAHQNKFEKRS